MANLVLVEQAAKESAYDKHYIRYLARKGFINGEKHGAIWLVDLDSLKEYEAQAQAQGTKKYDPMKYRRKAQRAEES